MNNNLRKVIEEALNDIKFRQMSQRVDKIDYRVALEEKANLLLLITKEVLSNDDDLTKDIINTINIITKNK